MKLTKKTRAQMLRLVGSTADAVPCDILSAAARIAVDIEERADATSQDLLALWRRFMSGFGLRRSYWDAIEHERARRRAEQQAKQNGQPPPPPAPFAPANARGRSAADSAAKQMLDEAQRYAADPKRKRDIGGAADALATAKPHSAAPHTTEQLAQGQSAPGATDPNTPRPPNPNNQLGQPVAPSHGPGSGLGHAPEVAQIVNPLWADTSLAQAAQRLRSALEARTMSRTVHETESGALDRSRLAQIGAGLTLRPYRDTTPARHLATCVYVMIDASGSMTTSDFEASPINHARRAALAIVQACLSLRVPVALGAYDDTPWRVAHWGATLAEVRTALERLGGGGGTMATHAVELMRKELATRRERRKVALFLCDGDTRSTDPTWSTLAKSGIDFRLAQIGAATPQALAALSAPHWRNRYSFADTGPQAAKAMLDNIREMLEHGAREDIREECFA